MRILIAATITLALTTQASARADDNCELEIRKNFGELIDSESPHRQWVEFNRTDGATSGSRQVAKNEPAFSADFRIARHPTSMVAPRTFIFKPNNRLSLTRTIEQGTRLRIEGIFTVASGERFYALPVPGLLDYKMFTRADGTLCNKILRISPDSYVFIVGQYKSIPSTKLRADVPQSIDAPLNLSVIYLGSSDGNANYRAIWSRNGRTLGDQKIHFSQDATAIQIAGMEIPVSNMTVDSVTVGDMPLTNETELNAYWSTWFRK